MPEKNCRNCKFWTAPDKDMGDYKLEDLTNYVSGFGRCGMIGMYGDDNFNPKTEIAAAQDGSTYFACLRTKAEFFCILHG